MTATAGLVAVLVLSGSVTAFGQSTTRPRTVTGPSIEYGSPSELKGVHNIFVDTGTSIGRQQEIVKRLQKDIPSLTVVRNPADAEVILIFKTVTYTRPSLVGSSTTTVNPDGSTQTVSQAGPQVEEQTIALVEKPLGPNRVRLLMEYDWGRFTTVEKIFGTNGSQRDRFVRQFVDAWKKANGIK
jgi:hypothetical protein